MKIKVTFAPGFLVALDRVSESIRREVAMRARFAGSGFTPCTLEDEQRHDRGEPFFARDAHDRLHMIGSDLSSIANKCLPAA